MTCGLTRSGGQRPLPRLVPQSDARAAWPWLKATAPRKHTPRQQRLSTRLPFAHSAQRRFPVYPSEALCIPASCLRRGIRDWPVRLCDRGQGTVQNSEDIFFFVKWGLESSPWHRFLQATDLSESRLQRHLRDECRSEVTIMSNASLCDDIETGRRNSG